MSSKSKPSPKQGSMPGKKAQQAKQKGTPLGARVPVSKVKAGLQAKDFIGRALEKGEQKWDRMKEAKIFRQLTKKMGHK